VLESNVSLEKKLAFQTMVESLLRYAACCHIKFMASVFRKNEKQNKDFVLEIRLYIMAKVVGVIHVLSETEPAILIRGAKQI
jgi:hypothetical protein